MKTKTAFYLGLSFLSIGSTILPQIAIAKPTKNNKKPNVLFLLTDDQTYNTINALGNKEVHTPNMDRLVKRGMSFTQTHVMGATNGAVSMPSRAMLMTGMYLSNIHQDGRIIPNGEKTFPEVFRENGYTTFATGKWHSDKASFNRSFSTGANIFFGGMHPYNTNGHFNPFLHEYDPKGEYKSGKYVEKYSSVCYADAAVDFLETKKSKEPFLMYIAFTSPHDPRTPPAEYGKKYTNDDIDLPLNFLLEHPFDNGDLRERDELIIPIPRNPDSVKKEIALYYGMVSEVDVQIGRILDALEAKGDLDNTIIVFAADNGLAVGQHGLLGKQNLYEHSSKVPLVISGPGILQDARNEAFCYLLDIYPTLCDLAGIKIPGTVNGISLKNALDTGQPKGRESIFLSYINIQRAIKKDNYKLILYNVKGDRRVQLFDLSTDPWERDNLADMPAHKNLVNELTQLLYAEMKAKGDFCEPDKPDWGYPSKLTWDEALKINP